MIEEKIDKYVLNLQKDIPIDSFLNIKAKFKLDKNGMKKSKPDEWWFNIEKIDNMFLLYNRLIPRASGEPYKNESKNKFLAAFLNRYKNEKTVGENIFSYKKRLISSLIDYKDQGYYIEERIIHSTDWRVVPGLGSESVLETAISLHHLFGFPYLTASSVKGIARAHAEKVGLRGNELLEIFGSENKYIEGGKNRTGSVIFFEGLPASKPELGLDIMNVHYPDYYGDKNKAPGDWMDPQPIYFISVKPGQQFNFFLASRKKELLLKAKEYLEKGLQELGIGAKTSSGYGYFS